MSEKKEKGKYRNKIMPRLSIILLGHNNSSTICAVSRVMQSVAIHAKVAVNLDNRQPYPIKLLYVMLMNKF